MTIPKVSVHMPAYNHGPYLATAIESALGQKTDFPFEIVIGEDCSQDNTRDVALAYAARHPEIVKVLCHPTNVGIWENDQRIIASCRGEYIAWLEGDDYWCSGTKLQRQIDLLERAPGLSACFHRAKPLATAPLPDSWKGGPQDSKPVYTLDDLLEQGHFVPSCTAVFRTALARPPMLWTKQTPFLEVTYFVHFATQGDIGFFDEELAVFRYNQAGVYGRASRAEHLSRAIAAQELAGQNLGVADRASFRHGIARMQAQLDDAIAKQDV
jgi:glycosyltransferase involved in cell wall biosynthesis